MSSLTSSHPPLVQMLSPEDNDVIARMGLTFFFNTVQDTVGAVLYGIYLVLFVICMRMTLNHPLKSRASKILLSAMLLLFVATTSQFVFDMTLLLNQLKGYLMATEIPLEDRRSDYIAAVLSVRIAAVWPIMVNFMVSDLIVVWRAWVLYPRNYLVKIVLSIFIFADLFLWLFSQGLVSKHAREPNDPTTEQNISTASTFISLGTNVMGTLFIGVKAWHHSRLMRGPLQSKKHFGSDVSSILVILVETGAIFAALQLVTGILGQVDEVSLTPLDLATDVIGKAVIYFAAILPTATVIIVRSHKSLETWSIKSGTDSTARTSGKTTKLSTIRFGGDTNTQTRDTGLRSANSDTEALDTQTKEKDTAERMV